MTRKHHHVVSEGYQRLFASPSGIRLLDKQARTARVVGTKSAFARKRFSSYVKNGRWSDELEDEWSTRENFALPHIRRLISGARDESARDAVKVLAAVHYVRSYAFEIVLQRIMDQEATVAPSRMAAKVEVVRAFETDYGRLPRAGEVEQLVLERWMDLTDSRRLLIGEMAEGFNKTMNLLQPLRVQLVWPRKKNNSQFIFGDTPVVHYAKDGRVSVLGGLALGDANRILFPLSPYLAALFTKGEFGDGAVDPDVVQSLNRKVWQAAVRFVAAHPDTNLKRSLSVWDFRIES